MKENDRVYLKRVPPTSSLSPLPEYSMVKPLNMGDVLDASTEKRFASLVPYRSAKALSRYTKMVDEITTTQAEKLRQGSELARVIRKEIMDLPDQILALKRYPVLPTALREDVEAVQIRGGPARLEGELQQLRDLTRVQTGELLQKEAVEDAQFRSQFGTWWTRPWSSTLTKNLQDELNRLATDLKQAAESVARIERSARESMTLMSILDRRPIESALPTLAKPIMSLDANEDALVRALKNQSLRKLETLGVQRASLEDMLKDMKRKDDIRPKLMKSTCSHEDLFEEEITKYNHICEEISQNLQAQQKLLLHIQAQNSEFAVRFNFENYRAACDKFYKQIEAAVAKYREIKGDINQGLKFYVTLQDSITSVKQQCNNYAMMRNIQCREMIEAIQKQMSGLSFQDGKNFGSCYNYPSATQPQWTSSQPKSNSIPNHHCPQTPYYQQPPPSSYAPPHPPQSARSAYVFPQQQPPPPPYHGGSPYPPQQGQQPPRAAQGAYYNVQGQQAGSFPRPPYTGLPGMGANVQAGAGGNLDFLRDIQQFQVMRAMVQANPQILQPMLQEMGKQNPPMLRLIQEHQADFLRLINEPVEGRENVLGQYASGMPQGLTVTPEEREAIERLEAKGFDRTLVLEVFFACEKNEELAARYLLDHMHEFED